MNRRDLEKAIENEVTRWPGVTLEFVEGGKHPKVKLTFDGMMLSRPYAGTPGDADSVHITLGQIRRTMKQLGAVRDKPEPTAEEDDAPYRKPNDGADKRELPRASEPAEPQPDVADQLVAVGVASPEQREAVQAKGSTETYAKAREIVNVQGDDEDDTLFERMTKLAEFEAIVNSIVDGIYFDLPDDIYHAVRALGGSSLGKLLISAGDFWEGSWLDPRRPELDEEQTAAQLLGKAYHCARLEPEAFEIRFCRKPDRADYPAKGLLTSDEKVKAALKEMGHQQTFSGESTFERAVRLEDAGYVGTILPLEIARWERDIAKRSPRPTPLKAEHWDDILVDMERIRAMPEIADKLTGGFAEVSVFWTDENGLRCKARFDYLKVEYFDEFKTFANPNGKNVHQAIKDAVQYNRYYVAAAHYRDASEAIRTGGLPIRGPSSEAQRELIEQIQARELPLKLWYIFQQKGGVPNLYAKEFEFLTLDAAREEEIKIMLADENPTVREMARQALGAKSAIYKKALWEIHVAKSTFATYAAVYEPGDPWMPIDPEGTIGDADFHPRFLEDRG